MEGVVVSHVDIGGRFLGKKGWGPICGGGGGGGGGGGVGGGGWEARFDLSAFKREVLQGTCKVYLN